MHRNDRGVVTIIGALLTLSVILLFATQYVVTVAPQQATAAEYDTTYNIFSDMSNLRVTMDEAADSGRVKTARIHTSVDYPLTAQAGTQPMSYEYRTEPANVTLSNFNNSTSAFLDGKTSDPLNYDSERFNISFQSTSQNMLRQEAVGFEHGVSYRGDDSNTYLGEQTVVNDETVTIYLLDGNLGIARATNNDDFTVESTAFNETTVNQSTQMELSFETRASEQAWNDTLRQEFDENGGRIVDVTVKQNTDAVDEVIISFEANIEYTIYIARATVES